MKARHAIGIDLGGTNLRIALVAESGEIIHKTKEPTPLNLTEGLLSRIADVFSDEIVGIGLGVAGLVSDTEKVVLLSPNLPAVEKIDLVRIIERKFGRPVHLANDADAAAFGELWIGAGRDFTNFVLITLGTGIGGGVVHKGKLLSIASEIGHMSIDADGEKCGCGNNGCLELFASAKAILSRASADLESGRASILREYCGGNVYRLTPEDIHRAAFDGDSLAREVLKNAGRYLGVGLANVINLMSPQAIILAGGLTGSWDLYVQEAIRETSRRAFRDLVENVKILPALLGDDAGTIGAAGLVFRRGDDGS